MYHNFVMEKGLASLNEATRHAVQGLTTQTGHNEEFDKMWSPGEGNGNPFQYSCLENPMDSMKRQKELTPKMSPPSWIVSNMLMGKSTLNIHWKD